MKYCSKCKALVAVNSKDKCSNCGSKAKEPSDDDIMYLTIQEFVFAGMLEGILTENNIPHLKQPVFGAGITKGGMVEEFRFFVPLVFYKKAKALEKEYLGEK